MRRSKLPLPGYRQLAKASRRSLCQCNPKSRHPRFQSGVQGMRGMRVDPGQRGMRGVRLAPGAPGPDVGRARNAVRRGSSPHKCGHFTKEALRHQRPHNKAQQASAASIVYKRHDYIYDIAASDRLLLHGSSRAWAAASSMRSQRRLEQLVL